MSLLPDSAPKVQEQQPLSAKRKIMDFPYTLQSYDSIILLIIMEHDERLWVNVPISCIPQFLINLDAEEAYDCIRYMCDQIGPNAHTDKTLELCNGMPKQIRDWVNFWNAIYNAIQEQEKQVLEDQQEPGPDSKRPRVEERGGIVSWGYISSISNLNNKLIIELDTTECPDQ